MTSSLQLINLLGGMLGDKIGMLLGSETINLSDELLREKIDSLLSSIYVEEETEPYDGNTDQIGFDEMPKDVSNVLTLDDYRKALSHEDGVIVGLYEAVHANKKIPEWMNIMVFEFEDECEVGVYMKKKGWTQMKYKDVKEELLERLLLCQSHFSRNQ